MLLNRLPLFVAICLCILISGALYWQLHPLVQTFLGSGSPHSPAFNTNNTHASNTLDTSIHKKEKKQHNIARFKLFGDTNTPVKKQIIETEKLPETNLKLRLTGVLAGKNNILASALIEGPNRKTRNYRVDEEVPGGAILKQVYPDRVVLERSGNLENLIFEETRSIGISSQNADQTPIKTAVPSYTKTTKQDFNHRKNQKIKDRLSRLRNRLQNNRP